MQYQCVDCDGEERGGGADYLVEGDSDEIAAQEGEEESVGEGEVGEGRGRYRTDIKISRRTERHC